MHYILRNMGSSCMTTLTNSTTVQLDKYETAPNFIQLPYFREQFLRKLFYFGSWSAASIQGRKLLFSSCFISIHNLNTCRIYFRFCPFHKESKQVSSMYFILCNRLWTVHFFYKDFCGKRKNFTTLLTLLIQDRDGKRQYYIKLELARSARFLTTYKKHHNSQFLPFSSFFCYQIQSFHSHPIPVRCY